MPKTFAAEVDEWVKSSKARLTAVFQKALDATAEDMGTPVSRGGNLRVDTGFLRASMTAVVGQEMPAGPSINPLRSKDGKGDPFGDPNVVHLIIGEATAGDIVSIGFTANYAQYREPQDGFVLTAAQRWPMYVDKAVAEAKRRVR